MTQSARARRNYSCCFASLQLFKHNISYSNAGRWHIWVQVRQWVQFTIGVTLFAADQDQPEALLWTPAPHGQVRSDNAVRYILMVTWLQPKSHTQFSPYYIKQWVICRLSGCWRAQNAGNILYFIIVNKSLLSVLFVALNFELWRCIFFKKGPAISIPVKEE